MKTFFDTLVINIDNGISQENFFYHLGDSKIQYCFFLLDKNSSTDL